MDLQQQPQGQPVNTDLKNHSLLPEEFNYYQSSLNIVKQPNSSPQNSCSNEGQQVFRQLDQQHLPISVPENSNSNSMAECTSIPHSYIDTNSNVSTLSAVPQQSVEINSNAATNSTTHLITVNPKVMEHIPANTSQTAFSVTNCSHPSIHSNVIPNTDQNRLVSSQLPSSNNTLIDGAVNRLYNNNSLSLPHDSMFSMSSLPNSISLNQPSTYAYLEHSVHQQLQQQSQEQVQNEAQRQANAQIQVSQTHGHLQSHSQMQQQPPSILSNQPNIEHHPVVSSHRTLDHPHTVTAHSQHALQEEQGRIDAATQHVIAQQMAHQYVMLQQHITSGESQLQNQKPLVAAQHQLIMANGESLQQPTFSSQDTHHVVLSQMTMLSPSSTNNIQEMKEDASLHNAVIQRQYQKENANEPTHNDNNKRTATDQHVERRKSRRHTVSNSKPLVLNIDTNNVHILSSSPKSAADLPLQEQPLAGNKARQVLINQQNGFLANIDIPLPLNLQELETTPSTPSDISVNNYDKLSRAQLISRLIKLETEKRQNMEAQNEKFPEKTVIDLESAVSPSHQVLMLSTMEEEKSTADEDEDEEDEPESLEEQSKEQKMQCRWKECRLVFDGLQTLIDHVNSEHIGSGKPSYFCEWENCPRNEKPFTKRHKMYNHLRTHTGERPFICTEEGCGKKFSRPDSLSTHIKTHSNIRPFICRVKECGKAYYHARSLKKHEKSHEIAATIPGVYFPNVNAIPFNTTPFGNTLPGHADYLNSQFQYSSVVIHNQSLPNSPHPSAPQQGITNLQSSSPIKDNYTLSNDLLFSSAGMVEQQQNNTHLITQQQLLDSVNLQQNSGYNYGQI